MTTLTLAVPHTADVSVAMYNVAGRAVATLADGSFASGVHSFTLDGSGLTSGLYFVRATAPGRFDAVRKLTLLK